MAIRVEYLRVADTESTLVAIEPEVFFDRDGDESFSHAHQLLKLAPSELVFTVLEVATASATYRIRTQYFAGGGGWMTHRWDDDGSEELIHVVVHGDHEVIVKTTKPATGTWMTIGASCSDVDVLRLRSSYEYDRKEVVPARVAGSFATIVEPRDRRRGPWPSTS